MTTVRKHQTTYCMIFDVLLLDRFKVQVLFPNRSCGKIECYEITSCAEHSR